MTNEEMNWFLRGGKRPDPAPKAPVVVCQNCGGENLADEEQCTHCGAPLQGGTTTEEYCGGDDDEVRAPDQKTYLVKVNQVKKCLWEGYVEVVASSKLEALFKARDKFDSCELDTWDLVDPDLDSDDDEEPVYSIEPEA